VYNYVSIPTPVTRAFALQTIEAVGVATHSPRVTAALMLHHLRVNSQAAHLLFHTAYLNKLFVWNGNTPIMFNYYTRTPEKLLQACAGGRLALPVHAFTRACKAEGWLGNPNQSSNAVRLTNPNQTSAALPQHVIEILGHPGLNLNI
jgi:hypothetical protein